MVKPQQRTEIYGFSKGLNTEVNPLNNQIDTTVDECNFDLNPDGTRSRRLGLASEIGAVRFPTGITNTSFNSVRVKSFLWTGVSGDSRTEFLVVQLNSNLRFFKMGAQGQPTEMVGQISLPVTITTQVTLSSLQGLLVVACGTPDIQLISYNHSTRAFTRSSFRIRIRDFFGLEETIYPQYETDPLYKGPLSAQHYYNLYNQGWGIPRRGWGLANTSLKDPVGMGVKDGKYPSNSDKVWTALAMRARDKTWEEPFEGFNTAQFHAVTGVDGTVSKGFFIIDAFTRGTSRAAEWERHKTRYPEAGRLRSVTFPADTTSGGPTSVATHAGRIFYSGINGVVTNGDKRSPNYANYIFFSQLVKNQQDFGKCYQEGDPTSRETFDLVDTDGGYIVIPDAYNIHTLYSVEDHLFVIADNGVWRISGGSGYGFTATNYMVTRMSSIGGVAGSSFVELGGSSFYFGFDGIYAVTKNQFGDFEITNISKPVIDRFFNKIPKESLATVSGFVDKFNKKVRWLYTVGETITSGVTYEIVLDLNFNSFTVNSYPSPTSLVLCGAVASIETDFEQVAPVLVNTDDVYSGVEAVITNEYLPVDVNTTAKFITITWDGSQSYLTFCELRNTDFQDWVFTGTPVDAAAYMESNAFTGGDFAIKKQVPYLTMVFAETEKLLAVNDAIVRESSCIGRVMWNFSHAAHSGKWSRDMQLYRKSRFYFGDSNVDNGFSLNTTKTKLRGIGKSLALRVSTEPLKDCHIYGWSLSISANSVT